MKVGFTTSLPIEVIYAAGHKPVDLNNTFATGDAAGYVEKAEFAGYPRNICAWIKGLYSVALEAELDAFIGVVEGDCSNTHSLMATLEDKGLKIITFGFPFNRKRADLEKSIKQLEQVFDVDHSEVLIVKQRLDKIRAKLVYLDELTWKEGKITGRENHIWQLNSSDFNSDPDKFEAELDSFLLEAEKRNPIQPEYRFAYLGVPPIFTDIYEYLEEMGVQVVFNEIQRQFAMPYLESDIIDQYLRYTYPYSIFHRLEDVKLEISKRNIDGILSYSQSFCHRQIDDILIKKNLDLPILTLEGDQPGELDARTKLRIESFLDMLKF